MLPSGDICRRRAASRQKMLEEYRFLRSSINGEFKKRNGMEYGISFAVQVAEAQMVFYQLFGVFLSPGRYFVQELDVVETQDVKC